MLNFLQLRNNAPAFFLVILVSLSGDSSAFEIGAFPSVLEYNGYPNDVLCKKLEIFTSKATRIEMNHIWEKGMDLETEHPEEISLSAHEKAEICVIAEKAGYYSGMLILDSLNEHVRLGIKLEADINEKAGKPKENKMPANAVSLMLLSNFMLFLILFFMIGKLKNIREKNQ